MTTDRKTLWADYRDPLTIMNELPAEAFSTEVLRRIACNCSRVLYSRLAVPTADSKLSNACNIFWHAILTGEALIDGTVSKTKAYNTRKAAGNTPILFDHDYILLRLLARICLLRDHKSRLHEILITVFASSPAYCNTDFVNIIRDVYNPFDRIKVLKHVDADLALDELTVLREHITLDVRMLLTSVNITREDGRLDNQILAGIADALEEAGLPPYVDNKPHSVLAHLRSEGPHYKGCYVVNSLMR